MYSNFKSVRTLNDKGSSLYGAACIFLFLSCLLEFVAGLVGIINSEESKYGLRCSIWGGITLATALAANILQIECGYGTSIYTWLTGAVTPALFIIAFFTSYIVWVNGKKTGKGKVCKSAEFLYRLSE